MKRPVLFNAFFCFGVLVSGAAFADMTELADPSMSVVSGQDGISLELQMRLNTDQNGNPIGTGCGSASPNYSGGVAESCRMGLDWANRPNQWLVLKDFYGWLNITNIHLDSACTGVGSSYVSGICSGGTSTQYQDVTRFQDQTGHCLLNGSGSACPSGVANNLSAFQLSFPNSGSSFQTDIAWGLTIGGMALETSVTGDSNGSFLGLKMADHSAANAPARFQLDGHLKVFGF